MARKDAAVSIVERRIARLKARRELIDRVIEQNENALAVLRQVESGFTVRVVKEPEVVAS